MLRSGPSDEATRGDAAPLHDDAALFDTMLSTERVQARHRSRVLHHAHTAHEMLWGFDGPRTIETGDAIWSLPPAIGLWIPAGVAHAGVIDANASYYCTFAHPQRVAIEWRTPTPVVITPLLRELLLHLKSDPDESSEERQRAERVAVDLIKPASAAMLPLPMPLDERARVVAEAIVADPSDRRTIDEWGRQVGAAGRTLHRLFAAETGMPFGTWRIHARIRHAIPLLASGRTVGEVSRRLGYRNAGAFVKAFRSATGQTPGSYTARNPVVTARRPATGDAAFDSIID